jgi:hypothetical protein
VKTQRGGGDDDLTDAEHSYVVPPKMLKGPFRKDLQMTITVFVWDMFRGFSVGHASMHVHSDHGSIYVSFWPQAHNPIAALSSPGHIHFMNGDRKSDGMPQWGLKAYQ